LGITLVAGAKQAFVSGAEVALLVAVAAAAVGAVVAAVFLPSHATATVATHEEAEAPAPVLAAQAA
jgi:hypothetical protein